MNRRKQLNAGLYTSDLSKLISFWEMSSIGNTAVEELNKVLKIFKKRGTCEEFSHKGMLPMLHKKWNDCILTNSQGQICALDDMFNLEILHCCEKCEREGFDLELDDNYLCKRCNGSENLFPSAHTVWGQQCAK